MNAALLDCWVSISELQLRSWIMAMDNDTQLVRREVEIVLNIPELRKILRENIDHKV